MWTTHDTLTASVIIKRTGDQELIVSKREHIYGSRSSASLLVWNIQVCPNTMLRRKDINTYLREALIAAYQSLKGYKAIFKQIEVILQGEADTVICKKITLSY